MLRNLYTGFILNYWLFGSVKLTKNADPDKFKYSDFGIEFGSCSEFLFTDVSIGKNVIFLEVIWAHLCILIIKIKIS